MTIRIRAGIFVDAEMEGNYFYFGYLSRASWEYDVAVAVTHKDLKMFINTNKVIMPTDQPQYNFGILVNAEDRDGNEIYTTMAYIEGKLRRLVIYPSQYKKMVDIGHNLNRLGESQFIDSLISL
jgi:hypothetical protein